MVDIEEYQGQPILLFASAEQWEDWLGRQPTGSAGLWVKLAKKGCETPSIDYPTALESALCFGWIDGQKRPYDESYWLQRFTPRKARSRWSRINRERATALIESGRMREAGLREVELARADGRWEAAYASQSVAEIPADLQAALEADEPAAVFFASLDRTNRYAVLYRIQEAKRAETRAKRIEKFVAMLRAQETIHPRPAKSDKSDESDKPSGPSKPAP
jgi:uncharacterized protein YdeI (YjbR/CyaY-like superfamily)